MRSRSLAVRHLLPGTLLVLAACQTDQAHRPSPPPESHHAQISNEFSGHGPVTALTPGERARRCSEDGSQFEVGRAGGAHHDQIAVGDALRVHYRRSSPPRSSRPARPPGPRREPSPPRAKPGENLRRASAPGSACACGSSRSTATTTSSLLARLRRAGRAPPADREGRAFAAELAVGDVVQPRLRLGARARRRQAVAAGLPRPPRATPADRGRSLTARNRARRPRRSRRCRGRRRTARRRGARASPRARGRAAARSPCRRASSARSRGPPAASP